MNIFVRNLVEKEIAALEKVKAEYPDHDWLYEPELSTFKNEIAKCEEVKSEEAYTFDSDSFIKDMESMEGVEETPLEYEEYEVERMNERDLRGGL